MVSLLGWFCFDDRFVCCDVRFVDCVVFMWFGLFCGLIYLIGDCWVGWVA